MAVFVCPIRASIHTDYLLGGSLIVKEDQTDRLLFDGGYAKAERIGDTTYGYTLFYYNKDHLGNIREVVNASGSLQQRTNYYPFGAPYADPDMVTNASLQPYKYNGKELDLMHGLNTYDYGARQYNPVTGRWDRVDPLCEKDYPTSPYVFCGNNPVNRIDPDGKVIVIEYKASDNNYYSLPFNGSGKYVYPKSQFVKDFFAAYNYNINNGGGKYMKKAAEDPNNIYYLRDATDPNAVETQETGFNPQEGKSYITWESRMGLKTTEGGHQSAATRLEHEFYHAVDNAQNPSLRRTKSTTPDPQYDYLEEREAINAENDTAIHNNEDPRNDHKGTPYPTVSPTSIQPK